MAIHEHLGILKWMPALVCFVFAYVYLGTEHLVIRNAAIQHNQSTQRFPMIAIRQIHEHLADVIEVPPELRNRKTELIFLPMDSGPRDSGTEMQESPLSNRNSRSAVEFFGSLPDFPNQFLT